MKKQIEPEKQAPEKDSQTTPAEPYSRFNEPVNEKPGLGQRVSVTDPSLLNKPIDEVKFSPPPVEKETHPLAGQQNGKTAPAQPAKTAPANDSGGGNFLQDPNLNNLPPSEKHSAAEKLTKITLGGYQKAHDFANKKVQISERKIMKYIRDGSLDLRALVPYELDQWMPIGELIKEFNKEYSQLFFISPTWRAEVEPPLTRIFEKRGMGMSDEMFVGLMFMQDIGMKVSLAFEAFARTNSVLQFAREQTARMRGAVQPMPARPRPESTPPPAGPAPVVPMPQPDPAPPAEEATGIPMIITAPVRQQLYDLGYTRIDVDAMSPEEAQAIVTHMHVKPAHVPVQDHFMGAMGNAGTVVADHPMGDAVVKSELPKWGENAEKLERRGRGRPPGAPNKKTAPKKSHKKKRA